MDKYGRQNKFGRRGRGNSVSNQITPGDTSPRPGQSRQACEVSCDMHYAPWDCNSSNGQGWGACSCDCCNIHYTWIQEYSQIDTWNFNLSYTGGGGSVTGGAGSIPIYETSGMFNSYQCNCGPCWQAYNQCMNACHHNEMIGLGSRGGMNWGSAGYKQGGRIPNRNKRRRR
tara:strand:+ start:1001 stop:1513 length:513 start_codon:yes stop_codon:yes gene_type:complete